MNVPSEGWNALNTIGIAINTVGLAVIAIVGLFTKAQINRGQLDIANKVDDNTAKTETLSQKTDGIVTATHEIKHVASVTLDAVNGPQGRLLQKVSDLTEQNAARPGATAQDQRDANAASSVNEEHKSDVANRRGAT